MLPKSTVKIVEYVCNKLRQHYTEIDDYSIYVQTEKVYINFSYRHKCYNLYLTNIIVEIPEMMLRYNDIAHDQKPLTKYILRILEKKILALGGSPLYETY